MSKPFKGVINLDVRDSVPDWEPYEQPKAPEGAPNVLFIVWDDTGFGALSPFGGPIEMPTLQRLADGGLRYSQFHTTAICSPTRASMLTGRNHTTVGMACIAEATTGFPGSNGHIPFETATIAEVLGERGYNTYMLGKWHCCPEDETNMASSKRNWPTGRGFERYYGFLGGETNQWYPDLVQDQQFVDQPYGPAEGRQGMGRGPRRQVPPVEGPRRPRDRDDRRRQAGRAGAAVLHVLLPGRQPCPAPLAEGVGGQVQGRLRRGLRERSARRSSPTRSRWGSSRRTPSSRRSIPWPG